ncbi:MAG: hypothetical protein AAGJ18_02550 [Bacteroidota bacterium]
MKFTNFLTIFSLFLLVACGGEEGISPDATLEGTWELQDFKVDVETALEIDGISTKSAIAIESENPDYELVFSATAYTAAGSYDYKGDVDVDGIKTSLDESVSNVTGNGTYTMSGDEITSDGAFFNFEFEDMDFDLAQEESKVKIEKLTDKELVMVQDETTNESEEVFGSTFSVTAKVKSRSVWKRK